MNNKKILERLKDSNTKVKSICEGEKFVEICYVHNENEYAYVMSLNEFKELLRKE